MVETELERSGAERSGEQRESLRLQTGLASSFGSSGTFNVNNGPESTDDNAAIAKSVMMACLSRLLLQDAAAPNTFAPVTIH